MILSRLNVTVGGNPSDVHARLLTTYAPLDAAAIGFCAVWQRPQGPVPGYWYFPEGRDAVALLTSLGVRS